MNALQLFCFTMFYEYDFLKPLLSVLYSNHLNDNSIPKTHKIQFTLAAETQWDILDNLLHAVSSLTHSLHSLHLNDISILLQKSTN